MRSTKSKLIIRHIEVEGSAETIKEIVKSLGDLFPAPENGEPAGAVIKVKRTKREFPTIEGATSNV